MAKIDEPSQVRSGEELDLDKLINYLISVNPDWQGAIELKQFPSGFSNLTYFLKIGEQEMVLRRPPVGANVKGGHDMQREYRVLAALHSSFKKVPQVFHYCEDENIIGGDFYLMDRVKGIILREPLSMEVAPNDFTQAAEAWLDTFVELHQLDYAQAGLAELGRPEGYNERQIKGWTKRYLKVKTEEDTVIDKVINWLNDNIPASSQASLIHNDYKYDNVIYTQNNWSEVTAILDWEMATLGDPWMDLGTSLGYWINYNDSEAFLKMSRMPTHHPGNPKRGELLHRYALKSGQELPNFVFHYAYGLFKIAIIVQQIYFRYKQGFTQDKRFAQLNQQAILFFRRAWQAIQKKQIDDLD